MHEPFFQFYIILHVTLLFYSFRALPILYPDQKKNPNRFCDSGLYIIIRCLNYLGELYVSSIAGNHLPIPIK